MESAAGREAQGVQQQQRLASSMQAASTQRAPERGGSATASQDAAVAALEAGNMAQAARLYEAALQRCPVSNAKLADQLIEGVLAAERQLGVAETSASRGMQVSELHKFSESGMKRELRFASECIERSG
jgi:hypothetical protein